MAKPRTTGLFVASGAMVLSCFHAWSAFLLAVFSFSPVSLLLSGEILFFSALVTRVLNAKSRRHVFVLACHLICFFLATFWYLHGYFKPDPSFFHYSWVIGFIETRRTFVEWMVLILVIFFSGVLWICGIRLVNKALDRNTISHRFDLGLGLFLLLLLIKLLVAVKEGNLPVFNSSVYPIVSFLIWGLFSLGWVRASQPSSSHGLVGVKGPGTVLGFAVIPMVLGGGLFILFLSELQSLAQTGARLLATVKEPLGSVAVAILRFLFASGCQRTFREDQAASRPPSGPASLLPDDGGPIAQQFMFYVFMGLLAIVLVILMAYAIRRLVAWLGSRTGEEKEDPGFWERVLLALREVKRFFTWMWGRILRRIRPRLCAEYYFGRLLRWGRMSGLSHLNMETPREYGLRLANRFPAIQEQVQWIIHAHETAVYGNGIPTDNQLFRARRAVKAISSPRLWLERIKSFYSHDRF